MAASTLIKLIKKHSHPLLPVPTSTSPKLDKLPNIKAVIFDVYGTMFLSAAGEISHATNANKESKLIQALELSGNALSSHHDGLLERFHAIIIRKQEQRKKEGIAHPEIDIRSVWCSFLEELAAKGIFEHVTDARWIERVAVTYECLVNPVWPEPSLYTTLQALNKSEIKLGIISNAQYFTAHLFEALSDRPINDWGFNESNCVWSYLCREAKPSTNLYQICAESLKQRHAVQNENILFVGNDMRNDILPASTSGFRTALYAGDRRSLRLREDDPNCKNLLPDLIITQLDQILDCIE